MSEPKTYLKLIGEADSAREKGAILISGRYGKVKFIGSSLKASLLPGEAAFGITIIPPAEKNSAGVVAVVVQTSDRIMSTRTFLLWVYRDEKGDAYIHPNKEWLSFSDCLLSIVDDVLVARTEDAVFTTSQDYAKKHACFYVPDANLLCLFATKKATEDDLRAAAEKFQQEKSALEKQPELLAEIDALRTETGKLQREKSELMAEIYRLAEKMLAAKKAHSANFDEFQKLIEMIRNDFAGRFFQEKNVKAMEILLARIRGMIKEMKEGSEE